MSKNISRDLFLLIKSLTRNEKGYFKKDVLKYSENKLNFIELFDAIHRQEVYDEDEIRKKGKFKGFPRLKLYLYERILSSLDSYYSGRDADMEVRKILNRVFILFEKGFYSQCIKQLQKAKDLAIANENFSRMLEVLEWERTLMIEKQSVENFAGISREEAATLEIIANLSLYKDAYSRITKLYAETIFVRTEGEYRQFRKIMDLDILKNESKAKSLRAKLLYYKIIDKYYSAFDDRKKYLFYSQKVIDLVESHPAYIRQNVMEYTKLLNNHIVTLSENGRYDDFAVYLNRLKNLPNNFPGVTSAKFKTLISIRVTLREFYHHIHLKDYDKVIELAKEIEKAIGRHGDLVSETHQNFFFYQIAYSYFIQGDFKKSLALTNNIINSPVAEEKLFFHGFARLLNMVIHFEMENSDLLSYLVKANYKFYEKYNKMYVLEKTVLDFFKVFTGKAVMEKKESAKLFAEFSKAMDHLPALEKKVFEYFDFAKWAESKVSNKPFKKMLEEGRG